MILGGVYPTNWSTDTLHGASRKAIYNKIELLSASISGIDLGIGIASSDIVWSNDAEKSSTVYMDVKLKEVIVYKNLKNIRVSWEHKTNPTQGGISQLYVNGVIKAEYHGTISDTYESVYDDISNIKYNDKIQIYVLPASSGWKMYVRNMKIKYMKFINNDP